MSPEPQAAALLLIPGGTGLPILGFTGDWARVEYLGQQGYVPLNELESPDP
jgi:hypothetical protein